MQFRAPRHFQTRFFSNLTEPTAQVAHNLKLGSYILSKCFWHVAWKSGSYEGQQPRSQCSFWACKEK